MKGWLDKTASDIVEKMTIEQLKEAATVGVMATILMTGHYAKKITKEMVEKGEPDYGK